MQTKADIRRECRKQTGVAWDPLSKFKNGDFNENDPKLKCYLKCFMQKYGIFGDDSIYIDRVLRYLPYSMQKTSKNTLEKCNLIPSTDSCDKAFQLLKCYFKSQPEVIFLKLLYYFTV
ncbi:hypothetical protein HCN44_005310 [Aphidius gifuensis]|uniref:Odorant-binding protein n=1 Tax=Aphidius gifuensis TaxID=684658 RepID=A0A834Y0N4_APHGI|nr:hypothetical protein HCN44_005310 [Aphidius gifuensis]